MTACISHLTALYSPLDIEYAQAMSGPYRHLSYSDSNGQVVAGIKDGCISGYWRPMVCTGTEKFQKDQINRLWGISDDIYYMDFLEDGLSPVSKFLLGRGYKARPYYTQVIDGTKSEATLYHDLRKSYKQLVKQARNELWISFEIESLKKFGFTDRCQESWNIQQRMLEQREAVIFGHDKGATMFYTGSHYMYYASMSGENAHPLIWDAMNYIGMPLEMGEQVYSGDEKLINISKFKAGFGGRTETRLILEKE